MFRSSAIVASLLTCADAGTFVQSQTQKFWPFTSSDSAPVAAVPSPKVQEAPAAEPGTVAFTREEVMRSSQFHGKVAEFCKDAKPEGLELCQGHMGDRLWCALFSRNIERFVITPGKAEERMRCFPMLKEESADWFMHATWPIRHSLLQVSDADRASEQFWPFTAWETSGEPAVAAVAPEPTPEPAPTTPPEPTVARKRAEIVASEHFQQKVAPFCKDVKPANLQTCKNYMGDHLWCALFARNIQAFLTMPDKAAERTRCAPMKKEKSADWFMQSTWQIRGALFLQGARSKTAA